ELAEEVYSKAGEAGLCNLILHHYLDKIPKILRGLSWKIVRREMNRADLVELIRASLEMEASVLFLIRYWDKIAGSLSPDIEVDKIIRDMAKRIPGRLTRNTIRRKGNVVIRIMMSCHDLDSNLIDVLRRTEEKVRKSIETYLRDIVCDIISESPGLMQWGAVAMAKVSKILECKAP
ncbi:MAG: hypothetical protein QXG81_04355, partial [Ignisphaera sp.]